MAKITRIRTKTQNKATSKTLAGIVRRTLATYVDQRGIDHIDSRNLPSKDIIFDCLDKLFNILFPGFVGRDPLRRSRLRHVVGTLFDEIFEHLAQQVQKSFCYECDKADCRRKFIQAF